MRNRTAALLILSLATGCSHTPQRNQRSTTPTRTHPTAATTPAPTPEASTATRQATSTPTVTPPSASTTGSLPSAPTGNDSASAATRFVEQLIRGSATETIPDIGIWSAVVDGGRIIQTTPLAQSAARATVAVSLAFDTPPDGTITEPIALRVELLHTGDRWTVLAVGYL